MDIQETERHLENPYVWVVFHEDYMADHLDGIFQTKEDAERYHSVRDFPNSYSIKRIEVKTYQTEFSEGQGPATTAVGEGSHPEPLPDAGT